MLDWCLLHWRLRYGGQWCGGRRCGGLRNRLLYDRLLLGRDDRGRKTSHLGIAGSGLCLAPGPGQHVKLRHRLSERLRLSGWRGESRDIDGPRVQQSVDRLRKLS